MVIPHHRIRWRFQIVAAALFLVPVICFGGENELLLLWKKHISETTNHSAMVNACRHYAAELPNDPLLPVVRGIEAWHMMSDGKKEEAARLLSPQLNGGPDALARGAERVARGWITRLQSERVVDALKYYYRKEVRYPTVLKELVSYPGLPGADQLPLKDAWGRAWRYRLIGFEGVPGFQDQKYSLESGSIQPPLNPAAALALPYAEQINVHPSRVAGSGAPGDSPVVKLEFLDGANKGQSAIGQLGEEVAGITVAYAGEFLVVLGDSLHWKIVAWK